MTAQKGPPVRCELCKHYTRTNVEIGTCRRFPPAVVPVLVAIDKGSSFTEQRDDYFPRTSIETAWPNVAPDDRCGEFKRKL